MREEVAPIDDLRSTREYRREMAAVLLERAPCAGRPRPEWRSPRASWRPWSSRRICTASQVRKGTTIPYVAHLLGVASIALEHGADEDEAIAALLHDAVEDQGGAPRSSGSGSASAKAVAAIVDGCTDTDVTPKPPWRARKEAYLAHAAAGSALRAPGLRLRQAPQRPLDPDRLPHAGATRSGPASPGGATARSGTTVRWWRRRAPPDAGPLVDELRPGGGRARAAGRRAAPHHPIREGMSASR